MRKICAAVAAAAVGMMLGKTVRADDIYLIDGNHITGTVSSVTDGKLTLNSAALGDTVIPMENIKTFSTETPISVTLADGTVVKSTAAQSDAGDILLNGGQKVSLTDIDQINPNPFTGSVSLGGSLIRGNSFADTLNAGYTVGYRVGQERLSSFGEYTYGDTKNIATNVKTTTTDRWELYGKYQHFYNPKLYSYVDADLTKDRIASLDLRFAPSAGAGYQWFNKAPLMFGTEAGVAWLYQKYTNGTPTHEPLAFKAAYHLSYDINSHVSVFNDLTYYPTVPRVSDYFISADVGLHTKLSKQLFTEFKIEWDYNSEPANGALKNDTRYILNLGYTL